MKTLTEFSTLMLRRAAAARATVSPDQLPASTTAPAPEDSGELVPPPENSGLAADSPTAEASDASPAPLPADGGSAAEVSVEAASSGEAVVEGTASTDAPADSEATNDSAPAAPGPADDPSPRMAATIAAVAAACGLQPDRAQRLLEALEIVERDIDRVRLVRVYQGEKGPHNSISRGEFHYVIDRVAGAARNRRDARGSRGGDRPERGGGGGGAGGSFSGGDRKPRGLGSLKYGAEVETKDPRDERPGRGEMPRAGIGWQLTSTPRTFDESGRGRGPGRRGPGGRGPGGRGPGGRGPGGPGGRGPGRGARSGPDGRDHDRGFRNHKSSPTVTDASGATEGAAQRQPRLGPDGQPLPPRSQRPRKPIGPDEKGLGPDGTPWDPERRAKRLAERNAKLNTAAESSVEVPASPSSAPAAVENAE